LHNKCFMTVELQLAWVEWCVNRSWFHVHVWWRSSRQVSAWRWQHRKPLQTNSGHKICQVLSGVGESFSWSVGTVQQFTVNSKQAKISALCRHENAAVRLAMHVHMHCSYLFWMLIDSGWLHFLTWLKSSWLQVTSLRSKYLLRPEFN